MTTLNPEVADLWRTAGTRIAVAGLDPDMEHREEMAAVAGAFAAAQATAYAAEDEMHRHLVFELLTSGALTAYGQLSRGEVATVEMVVARNWKRVVAEVGRLRNLSTEVAA
ncbi:Uncharacterised protein [Mycobacteroides abscessus]|uniref:hypothetical protein n=1 Tax=Mycobacteroides abscessus TaxID=36809 RepID=UPI0005E32BDF|nr:hypothetical protein [Mycobacteroides abscessus]CPS10950.1 Uncharacterised protein [Mycobacteroides abscessus]CPS50608.1 Uncharacterised protein [Mycobacteroides abscessus]CPS93592.1 Uncharacterised protein [Mycobacteroides abscessus]CPS94369.1 Uncharacterised protein [Mycobacteroides abscessus]CPT61621.1 Uncharacterised protein [Mycobacteroides abscessus]